MNIGYIGLGIMGKPAAQNLLAAGYPLGVWARRATSVEPLTDSGAVLYDSPAALAKASDIIITNVSDSVDVEAVVLGEAGIIHGLNSNTGKIVVDMSTIAPTTARHIACALSTVGAFFLDAPVSGGEKGAMDGTLTFMVGGDKTAFDRALSVLSAMGKTITHIGGSGTGQVAKACNQIIIGATLAGVADAFNLARANQTDLAKIREALLGGFAASKVLESHALRMISGDYAPGFKARLHNKDIGIALAEGKKYDLALAAAADFQRRLGLLIDADGGELDSSAIDTV